MTTANAVFDVRLDERIEFPEIGLAMASSPGKLSAEEIERLRALHLSHLRIALDLQDAAYRVVLDPALHESTLLDIPLEIALTLQGTSTRVLDELHSHIQAARVPIRRWLADYRDIECVRKTLGRTSSAHFYAGVHSSYAELNRSQLDISDLDGVFFAVSPQVHAFDNRTLVENAYAQGEVLADAHRRFGHLPVAVSPITLRPKQSNSSAGMQLSAQADPRQMSMFGAGWTLVSLKSLIEGGASSATYYETTGWLGVLGTSVGSLQPEFFPSISCPAFPIYHVLASVGDFKGGDGIKSRSTHPCQLDGLALQARGQLRILLANLTDVLQQVSIAGIGACDEVYVKYLDETNAEFAMTFPELYRSDKGHVLQVCPGGPTMAILPYGIAQIDGCLEGGATVSEKLVQRRRAESILQGLIQMPRGR